MHYANRALQITENTYLHSNSVFCSDTFQKSLCRSKIENTELIELGPCHKFVNWFAVYGKGKEQQDYNSLKIDQNSKNDEQKLLI